MHAPRKPAPDEPLSILGVLRCARRRPGTILLTTILTVGLTFLNLRFQKPTFESRATIHLDAPSLGGAFGDLGRLANLGASPAVESEIAALEARSLAESTIEGLDGVAVPTPAAAGYDRHPGLTTLVHDSRLSVYSILRRRFADPPVDGRPYVVPEGRLFAEVIAEREDAPRRIAVSFFRADRVRCSTPSLLASLRLRDTFVEMIDYAPGEPFSYRGVTIRIVPVGEVEGRTFVLERQSGYEAVDRLLARSTAEETSRGSGVIRVTVRDTDPRRAQDALAALCNNYMDTARARTQKTPDLSVEYITKLLDEQQRSFDTAQAEILRVQAETPEVLVVPEVAADLVQRLSDLELARVRLETGQKALAEIEAALEKGDLTALALLDGAGSAGFVGSLGLTVDPLTTSFVERIALVKGELVQLGQLYATDHPELTERRAQLDELVVAIRGQLGARTANLSAELQNVQSQRDDLRRELLSLPGRSALLVPPLLAVETYKQIVPYLTQSLHAAQISTSAAATTAKFFDRASLPTEMIAPNVGRTIFVGVALGVLLGLAIAFYREPRRGKVRSWSEVEEELGISVLGTVPRFPPAPLGGEGAVSTDHLSPPDAPAADAYRHLRARLEGGPDEGGPVIVAAIAAVAGAGTSTTNQNLAIALARHGERTLLVDANLRAPSVQATFGLPDGPGLAELLRGEATFEDVAHPTDLPGLHVVSAGHPTRPAGDVVTRAALEILRDAVGDRVDRVVLDLPGALDGAEATAVSGALHDVVLVTRARRSRRWQVRACAAALEAAGAPLRGVVVNDTRGRGATHPSQGGRS